MDFGSLDLSDPLGIAVIVIGAFVAFKTVKLIVKLLMAVVMLAGAYLWLGVDGTAAAPLVTGMSATATA